MNLTEVLENQSVILSREITKLEDVYSLIDVVEEKLRLDIRLTLLLLETDFETKIEEIPVLDIKIKTEVKETEVLNADELKENPEPSVHSDESDDDADDPNFKPKYRATIPKTEKTKKVLKKKAIPKAKKTKRVIEKKVIKDSPGGNLCNECGKMYADAKKLLRHKRTVHVKEKGCLCNECGKVYKTNRHLNRHRRVVHLKEVLTYTCPICKKEGTYKYYSDFYKHKQACEAELPEYADRYVCTICDAKFGTYYNWKNHHYVCSGEKPKRSICKPTMYKCSYENCDYIARKKIKLKNHINTVHLNLPLIKDFYCENCGKAFTEARLLRKHVETVHSTTRDHGCTICGNAFKDKRLLKKHLLIHSDIYSYVCPFPPCEKKFKQSATLYRHKLSYMSLLNLTETLDTQSVILSREITKLEDVYSLIDVVEEKLRLDIRLTLLLLETDFETKIEDIKTEVKETEEAKENQEPPVKSDDSEEDLEDADDPSFKPKYQDATYKTVRRATTSKKSKELKEDSTGETLCNECGKMYANARQLMRHKKTVHVKVKGSGSLCNECGKIYKNNRHLNRHKRAIHLKEMRTYTCPICKKEGTYKYYAMFFKHKQICEAEQPGNADRYVCTICDAKFGTYYNWKNHHYVCSGEKPKRSQSKPTMYKCSYENCDYVARLKIRLKNHINTVHLNLPEIKDHCCETCGKAFREPRGLKNHLNTVHGSMRDHTCTTCGSCFKTNEILKKHMKIHSDTYSYLCPFPPCQKKFKQSAVLYRHKLSCQFNPNPKKNK